MQLAVIGLIIGIIIISVVYRKFSFWVKTQKFNHVRPHVARFARKIILPFLAIALISSVNMYIQVFELFDEESWARYDTNLGKNVNIGAGTITCNYDGKKKNKTKILDGSFIGSNSALVAPIKIGKNSVVGAGSTLTKNVKNKSLSLTRANQIEIKNYKAK